MFQEPYITDLKQRKLNITFIAVGMFLGIILTSFTFLSLLPADAEGSTIDQVRRNQSELYEAAAKAKASVIETSQALDYIMSSVHENAKQLDFIRD